MSDAFSLTSSPPTSTTTYPFATTATSGWRNVDQTVTLAIVAGSGVDSAIHYSVDGGLTWTSSAAERIAVTVRDEGVHAFRYYASDSAGTEPVHQAGYINLDKTAPVTRVSHAGLTAGERVTLSYVVRDMPPTSGMAKVCIEVRDERGNLVRRLALGEQAANVPHTIGPRARPAKRPHTWHVVATDTAGNKAVRIGSARLRAK